MFICAPKNVNKLALHTRLHLLQCKIPNFPGEDAPRPPYSVLGARKPHSFPPKPKILDRTLGMVLEAVTLYIESSSALSYKCNA